MNSPSIQSHQHQKLAHGIDRIVQFAASVETLATDCHHKRVAKLAADLGTVAGKLRAELESIAAADEYRVVGFYRQPPSEPPPQSESLDDYDLSDHQAATRSLSRGYTPGQRGPKPF